MLKTFRNGLKDFIKNMASMKFNWKIARIWIKVDLELMLEKINGLLQEMLHNSLTLLAQTIVS